MSTLKRKFEIIFTEPKALFLFLLETTAGLWPDKLFLRLKYYLKVGKRLNLSNPQRYTEKIQWMKLYDHNPIYTTMVDKHLVKDYVANIIGSEYIIPTLGLWDDATKINFDELPNQFVLKCNHDSGGLFICRDKSKLTEAKIAEVRRSLNHCLKKDFYKSGREWPYKNVKRCIIAEKYMEDETGELRDYKIFCFNGEPKAMFIATDRSNENEDTKFDFYDMDFNHLPFTNGHPNANKDIKQPKAFEEMKRLAKKLTTGYPHIRADFYEINGKIYFGELTLYHHSGFASFVPEEWDYRFGSWLKLK